MTFYEQSKKEILAEKKVLLQATKILTNRGKHVLAHQVWSHACEHKQQRVLLPGEPH